ncbi:helix-turn-helix domain-containing protein [Natranaerobius thermophilus]|uniref:Transcriptional regulator, XRE family n=1 Tax=Natranaerobius thermophilus (strain ATCC BAA-1301 / DSM 18059 / JW/NM-WN-LF) TaxID=457570 RepID=B2A313_NATTJ|nr:tetratricopeptide repeat protein [Natranaerobius thermophilus]ACB83625.1 transcriptional regulator, XRE family [Natranaerobius thermophilus JW/NM-WN-LF]
MGVVGNNIGQKIKRARYEKDMTQEELAGKDFNRSFLSQIEKGLVKPSDRVLSIIADRLNLPLSYFYEPEDPDKDDEQAINALNKARNLIQSNKMDEALELITKSLKLQDISPKYAGLLMKEQGEIYFQGNNIQKSLSSLKKAKIIFGDHKYHHELCSTLNHIGEIYNQSESYKEATQHLQQAINILEDHFVMDNILYLDVYFNLALSYLGEQKYHEAINTLTQAIPYSSKTNNFYNFGELHYLLGRCYQKTGKFAKARVAFETAIEQFVMFNKNKYTGKTQLALGELEETEGNLTSAERYYLKALEQFTLLESNDQRERLKLKLLNIYLQLDKKEKIKGLAPFDLELVDSLSEKIDLSYELSKIHLEKEDFDNCFIVLQFLNDLVDRARRRKIFSDKKLLFYYSWMSHLYLNMEYYERGRKCLKQCNSIIKKLGE